MKELQLYIHLPFCVKKCAYCDFLSFPAAEETRRAYVRALVREIEAVGRRAPALSSLFLGGGTPSLLEPEELNLIFGAVHRHFTLPKEAECTIEANPGTITAGKAECWRNLGINRISMGVQSLEDSLLKRLGRIHTAEDARRQFQLLRKAGFRNISMDLMMGLPDQSLQQWQDTLKEAVSWEPEHISCYSLIVEEGTPFSREQEQGTLALPSEEEERAMYHWTVTYLKAHGYHQYEISNFAREGRESRHNLGYWERRPYIGVGLGAASLIEENGSSCRYRNTEQLQRYLDESGQPEGIQEDRQLLNRRDQMEEFMFLGLRKTAGISRIDFQTRFGAEPEEIFGAALQKQLGDGLLASDGKRYFLTTLGMDLGNQVFAAFLE